jgi:hypothetical protein
MAPALSPARRASASADENQRGSEAAAEERLSPARMRLRSRAAGRGASGGSDRLGRREACGWSVTWEPGGRRAPGRVESRSRGVTRGWEKSSALRGARRSDGRGVHPGARWARGGGGMRGVVTACPPSCRLRGWTGRGGRGGDASDFGVSRHAARDELLAVVGEGGAGRRGQQGRGDARPGRRG